MCTDTHNDNIFTISIERRHTFSRCTTCVPTYDWYNSFVHLFSFDFLVHPLMISISACCYWRFYTYPERNECRRVSHTNLINGIIGETRNGKNDIIIHLMEMMRSLIKRNISVKHVNCKWKCCANAQHDISHQTFESVAHQPHTEKWLDQVEHGIISNEHNRYDTAMQFAYIRHADGKMVYPRFPLHRIATERTVRTAAGTPVRLNEGKGDGIAVIRAALSLHLICSLILFFFLFSRSFIRSKTEWSAGGKCSW